MSKCKSVYHFTYFRISPMFAFQDCREWSALFVSYRDRKGLRRWKRLWALPHTPLGRLEDDDDSLRMLDYPLDGTPCISESPWDDLQLMP